MTYYVNGLFWRLLDFEWDDAKNLSNQRKHGLSFSEVTELFQSGGEYFEIFDQAHSESEDRFIAIGPTNRGLVVVVYTELEEDRVRIIGARPANKREQALYRSHTDQYR